jgi:DNA-binding protein YbaB
MSDISAQDREKYKAAFLKMKAEMEKLEKEFEKIEFPGFVFTGLVKKYMEAVKASDGLTSAKPSCTTAVQKAEKDASPANLAAVKKAFEAQVAEVTKAAKGDRAKEKNAAAFKKAMDAILDKIERFENS